MSIENEAFIDLEQMLHTAVNGLWLSLWRDLQKEMTRLANEGDWYSAQKLAQNIDLTPIAQEVEGLARTLAEAALFLGASRVVPPADAIFFGAPDERLIENGVEQWSVVLTRNATIALQTQAEIQLADLERKFQEKALTRIVKADPDLGRVGRQGTQFSRAASALMISRMSTAGFMAQAQASGIKTYRVSEVMDGRTCPVCSLMHNKTYPVSDGAALSGAIMNATDPESLRSIAPFPSQSAANVKALGGMSQGQLVSGGHNLPPYHPNCRGIVTLEVKNSGASLTLGGSAVQAGVMLSPSEDLSPDELAERMFGEFDNLDDALLGSLVGGAIIYGDNEGDDDEEDPQ